MLKRIVCITLGLTSACTINAGAISTLMRFVRSPLLIEVKDFAKHVEDLTLLKYVPKTFVPKFESADIPACLSVPLYMIARQKEMAAWQENGQAQWREDVKKSFNFTTDADYVEYWRQVGQILGALDKAKLYKEQFKNRAILEYKEGFLDCNSYLGRAELDLSSARTEMIQLGQELKAMRKELSK